MTNTLGLDGDLDPIYLIKDLELAFGLRFSDEEVGGCRTVGDIHALLIKGMGGANRQSERCATAMAFHRLCHAFRAMAPEVTITPAMPLHLFSRWPAKSLLKRLGLLSGLRLPKASASKTGLSGAGFILFAMLGLAASGVLKDFAPSAALWSFRISLSAMFAGALILKMAAAKNFGMLARQGAGWSDGSLWQALIEIVSERTALSKSDIRPDTLLLQRK